MVEQAAANGDYLFRNRIGAPLWKPAVSKDSIDSAGDRNGVVGGMGPIEHRAMHRDGEIDDGAKTLKGVPAPVVACGRFKLTCLIRYVERLRLVTCNTGESR
jgi:hypothetical protein